MSRDRVRRLVVDAGHRDDQVLRLCALAVDRLAVSGAGVAVTDGTGSYTKLAATDRLSDQVEDLQILLGQGPCIDAVISGAPVLVGDLGEASAAARWPVFAAAATQLGVHASFSMPLVVGDLRVGAMDLYRRAPGPLDPPLVEEALDYAAAAVEMLLLREETAPRDQAVEVPASSVVYQATGMVMVQIDTDPEAAYAALRARAFQEGRDLSEVARDVLERRLRLSDEGV
jgi:hypothetical protein